MILVDRLNQILNSIDQVFLYAQDYSDFQSFLSDQKGQDARLMKFIVIGETANNLSDEFRGQHYEIPWHKMIGMRNMIAHGYAKVEMEIVWGVIKKDLPELRAQIRNILGALR